jgi:phosphate acyltransferase
VVGRSSFCQKKRVIGVDLAGADVDQLLLFAACQEAAAESSISLRCYLSIPHQIQASSIECLYCPDVISMSDEALPAIRKKKDSSLVRAMMDVKSGETSAVVTCANTGAVTAASVIHLKRFSGLHHPALIAELPLPGGRVIALDMGAFVGASGRDLVSYSYLGRAYALLRHGIQRPRVGLLNIGREQGRGTPELRLADHLLSSSLSENWEYVGNVEPSDVFSGKADVLVTSGFAGNIFLKTAEAAVQRTHSSFLSYQPQGALLGGVRGVVVKCHGSASKEALITAISQAQNAVASNLVQKLEEQFSRSLGLAAKE